jgi:hypothetical protein
VYGDTRIKTFAGRHCWDPHDVLMPLLVTPTGGAFRDLLGLAGLAKLIRGIIR